MIMKSRILLMLLALCLLLSACGGGQTAPTTEPEASAQPTAAPTTAPTEPPETQPPAPQASPVVKPDSDKATGTLNFYLNDKTVYAGGPVSDLIDAGVRTYSDLSVMIQPGQISGNTRVQIETEDIPQADWPFLFFTAINTGDEPLPLSECRIYSITVNCEDGIRFGSGKEKEPFVTMQSTQEELLEAYGEPGYSNSTQKAYLEIAYYEPFNCAYFSFKNGVVRQVMTYYCADLFEDLAHNCDLELEGYFGSDAYILMSQYLDVKSYLEEAKAEDAQQTESTRGILSTLEETIALNGETITLGCTAEEMPELFAKPFEDLVLQIDRSYYIRTGRENEEEFYLINMGGMKGYQAKYAVVKGVITQNRYYTNWGFDYSAFHEFEYQGLRSDSTIEDVLELFGAPKELLCTSSAKACFVWMHYEDEQGNTLRVSVDPMVNQIVELRVSKYFAGEHHY